MVRTNYAVSPVKLKVVGLGGAGCNAINRMIREQIQGVEFIAMNTDTQHLAITEAAERVQLGRELTHGLGTGGDPEQGRRAAEESRDEIKQALTGADMVFITAGMGGGTGTGAVPLVAEIAMQSEILTIAIVTKPFKFEGTHRNQVAEEGVLNIFDKVDTLIVLPNENLLLLGDKKINVENAFVMADEFLFHGVQAITEIITIPGLINLDFASVRTVLKDAGPAWMSIGKGSGSNRVIDAARNALDSPLMDISIAGAKRVLFNISSGGNLSLAEVKNTAEVIQQTVGPDANIIFGVANNPKLGKDVQLTLIATGFATKEMLTGANREKEIKRLLRGIKSEEELNILPLLRYRKNPLGHR